MDGLKTLVEKRKKGPWLEKWVVNKKRWTNRLLHMWNIPIICIGFLLGRTLLLDSVSPFALAFFAVVLYLGRKSWPIVLLSVLAGASTLDMVHTIRLSCFLLLLLVFQKGMQWMGKGQIHYAPTVVLFSGIIGYLLYFWWGGFHNEQLLLASLDVFLSWVFTLIFMKAIPLFTVKKQRLSLRTDEMICLVVLLGAAIMGTMGWFVWNLSVVQIITQYAVLLLAWTGGALLGTTMGVVAGLILCLVNPMGTIEISLLALSGLLAGLMKENRFFGAPFGFLLGATFIHFYQGISEAMWFSLLETSSAILLYWLTPRTFLQKISKWIPGTLENQTAHQAYVRRLRDITAMKIEQFTSLFSELAQSFRWDVARECKEGENFVHHLMSEVMENACVGCPSFSRCWEKDIIKTFQGMTDLMTIIETKGDRPLIPVPSGWLDSCMRPERLLSAMQERYAYHGQSVYWKKKIKDSQRLVSEQLTGMAEVLEKLAEEIRYETKRQAAKEDQIREALAELDLPIQRVDVISLEEGRIEIELLMVGDEGITACQQRVVPLLTEMVGEPIAVFRKVVQDQSASSIITLGSAQRYTLKTGVATVAKGNGFVSGDSYCCMNLGTSKYAVALSDGMGNGARAQEESSSALKLLRRLLQVGVNEKKAVETVNAILRMRSAEEMFATIDLAIVDLNTAHARFMKIASTPGFIKRNKKVITLHSSNPPIGILNEIEIDSIEMPLEAGDMLILMTDGIYDAPRHLPNKELIIQRLISQISTKDPQVFADALLEKVIQSHGGKIQDDMTVIVAKIENYASEWSTVQVANMPRLERVQVVE